MTIVNASPLKEVSYIGRVGFIWRFFVFAIFLTLVGITFKFYVVRVLLADVLIKNSLFLFLCFLFLGLICTVFLSGVAAYLFCIKALNPRFRDIGFHGTFLSLLLFLAFMPAVNFLIFFALFICPSGFVKQTSELDSPPKSVSPKNALNFLKRPMPVMEPGGGKVRQGIGAQQKLRNNSRVITVLVATCFYVGSFSFFSIAWFAHKENQAYQVEGVKVPAKVIGYEFHVGRQSGDRPLLRYVDRNGTSHDYLAIEYGAVGRYGRRTLPFEKIEITYLLSQPEKARVEKWRTSGVPFGVGFGSFLAFAGTFLVLYIRRNKT